MTSEKSDKTVRWFWLAASAAVGVAVEIIIRQLGHRRESWDSPYYWKFGIPAMTVGAFLCSFFARGTRIGIGYAPFFGQLITMVLKTGGGSMLPLGIILMAVIGLSGVLAASLGAALGKRVMESGIPP